MTIATHMYRKIDPIQARGFQKLRWHTPKQILINLRYIETHLPHDGMEEKIRRLRTNELKEWREARDAAIFAYGLEDQILKRPVAVAKAEEKDYDFIIAWQEDDARIFYPVQLKELPPEDLNPDISLEELYKKLDRYSGTSNLAVAVRISRTGTLQGGPWLKEKRPAINELWLFGCKSPDQFSWFLCGDILKPPKFHEFSYPVGAPTFSNITLG